jgi:plastocyanin
VTYGRRKPSVRVGRNDRLRADIQEVDFMSLIYDSLRAFAAGGAACCVLYAATAYSVEARITIDNFSFKRDTITVPLGTTVVWENDDDIPHNVVATDGEFRSSALDTENKFAFTFNKAGTFDYFCSLHSFMKGQVVVAP